MEVPCFSSFSFLHVFTGWMQNFGSTVSTESILEERIVLKCILKCCRVSEKLCYENTGYNLGQIFSADVSDAFSWKASMAVSERSDPMFSHHPK